MVCIDTIEYIKINFLISLENYELYNKNKL